MTRCVAIHSLIFFLIVITGTLFTSRADADFRTEVLADNPFLYYEFKETSGTTAVDSALGDGNADNGTYRQLAPGGFALGQTGPVGSGVRFDGNIGASVRVLAGTTGVATGTWSVEMIVRVDEPAMQADPDSISLVHTSTYSASGGTPGGALHFVLENEGGLFLADAPSSGETGFDHPTVLDGQFRHIILTSDNVSVNAADRKRRLYVNGTEIVQTEGPNPLLGAGGLTSFNGLFDIGSWNDSRFLSGTYDEFAIYNSVLSPARAFAHFLVSGTKPETQLIINRGTAAVDNGSVLLKNISGGPLTIDSYQILSDAGALAPAEWDPIAPASGFVVTSQTEFALAENDSNNPATLLTLADGATIELATGGTGLWKRFIDQDVKLSGIDGNGDPFDSIVTYSGDAAIFGDLDDNGVINVADYQIYLNGLDQDVEGLSAYDAYFLADLNFDGTHNFEDFIEFATAYDAFPGNGAGAFQSMLAGVPEPSTWALMAVGLISILATRRRCMKALAPVILFGATLTLFSGSTVGAAELVEYEFAMNFNDTSGNNRHGLPQMGQIFGDTPTVSGGKLNLHGDFLEGLKVPLGAANPFGGLVDYTLEMKFTSTGNAFDPALGVTLFGSADATNPTDPDNQSLGIYLDRILDDNQLPTGEFDLVVAYFDVGEVRVENAGPLLNGSQHSIKVVYQAPDDPGTAEDPNPGLMFINLDGIWRDLGEIAPRPPTTANHDVRIGGTLNTVSPLAEQPEVAGTVDDFRIFNDADMAPDLLRLEVDLTTGEITMLGGDFAHDLRYYEIVSDAGSLNSAGWDSLEDQGIDAGVGNVHWDEQIGSASQLSEGYLLGSSLFNASREESLGNAFTPFSAMDLEFVALNADLEVLFTEILYVNPPAGLPGDYNMDGTVDAADYVVFRKTINTPAAYNLWRTNFGRSLPGSGGGDASATGVPEPASWLLGMAAACICGVFRNRS